MPKKYPPLTLKEFEEILYTFKVVNRRTKGGHVILTIELESKKVSIVYQTHKSTVPPFVVKNAIKALGITPEEFYSRTKRGSKKINKK